MDEWTFTPGQLLEVPSLRHMDINKVNGITAAALRFISQAGRQLRLPALPIATAATYWRRFYTQHSLTKYDAFHMGQTCLFLASKVEEVPKKLEELIKVTYQLDPRNKNKEKGVDGQQLWLLKETVLGYERILLATLAFNLSITHPHKYMMAFLKQIGATKEMSKFAWKFVTLSAQTDVCIRFKPSHVAVGVLLLAAKATKFTLKKPRPESNWFDIFEVGVTRAIVDQVSDTILAFVEKLQDTPKAVPPAPQSAKMRSVASSPALLSQQHRGAHEGAPSGGTMPPPSGGVARKRAPPPPSMSAPPPPPPKKAK